MIALADLQQFTKDLVADAPYFAGENVIKNTGVEMNAVEKALSERGFCVIVHPFERGKTKPENARGTITPIDVPGEIDILLNPTKNATIAQKDGMKAVSAIAEAMRGYAPVNPSDRYEIPEDTFELITSDPGLWFWVFRYNKKALL